LQRIPEFERIFRSCDGSQ